MSDCIIPADQVNGQGHNTHTYCADNTAQRSVAKQDASTETMAGQTVGTSPERVKHPRKRRMRGRVPMSLVGKVIGLVTAMTLLMVPVVEIVKILVELSAKAVAHYFGV